jgi:hypothetical protein
MKNTNSGSALLGRAWLATTGFATRVAAEVAAFRKWLDERHPADPKIEVSVVENKV